MPAKEITTLGFLLEPRFNEHWGMEFEGAKQFGRTLNGNRQTGGWMAHGGINYHPSLLKEFDSVLSLTTTYYSGDANRTEADDNDTAFAQRRQRHRPFRYLRTHRSGVFLARRLL
jgi:hypothetical protein